MNTEFDEKYIEISNDKGKIDYYLGELFIAIILILMGGLNPSFETIKFVVVWCVAFTVFLNIIVFKIEQFHLPNRFYFGKDHIKYFQRYDTNANQQLINPEIIYFKYINDMKYKNNKYSKYIHLSVFHPKNCIIKFRAPRFETCNTEWNEIITIIQNNISHPSFRKKI